MKGAQMRFGNERRKGGEYEERWRSKVWSGRRFAKGLRLGGNACTRNPNRDERAGHNGIRHPCRRARGHSNPSDNGFPSSLAGALERHSRWNKRPVIAEFWADEDPVPSTWLYIRRRCDACLLQVALDERGQSTAEYAVIMAGFLSLVAALSALWHAFDSGLFVSHVLSVASHHIQLVAPVTIADLFLY